MIGEIQTKAVVSVSEMARMCRLSRARFYQLQKAGVFPPPVYSVSTRRPIYVEELQNLCLEVRRRNCGINDKPVLFYSCRLGTAPNRPKAPKPKLEPKGNDVSALVDGLNSLGLTTATAAQIQKVTEQLFPKGTAAMDQGEVLRAVFLHLKRQNSADNVGR
jgi:hypothetical protein